MGTTTAKGAAKVAPGSPLDFITTLLTALHAPATKNNVANVGTWLSNEQSTTADWAANRGNPLGVTNAAGEAAGRSGNTKAGALATASNLLNAPASYGYGAIVKALRTNAPASTFNRAVTSSSWNGSRYGGSTTFAAKGAAQKANPTGWWGQHVEPIFKNPLNFLVPGGGMVVDPSAPGGPTVVSGVSAIPGASAVKAVTSTSGLIHDLTSRNTWIFIGGAALAGVGLLIFFASTKTGHEAATAATLAA